MNRESSSPTYRWVLPLIVGICFGGLGGAVFTWYVNRPRPTIVTYRIATTTLMAPEASGLIPDLKVVIRGTATQSLYSQNIEMRPRQGPFVDQAEVAFSFSSPVRIYGIHLESPSDLHRLECTGFAAKAKSPIQLPDLTTEITSVQCIMKPILYQRNETHPFRVTIATDSSEVPHVVVAAKNLELVPADEFSPKEQREIPLWVLFVFSGLLLSATVALMVYFTNKIAEVLVKGRMDFARAIIAKYESYKEQHEGGATPSTPSKATR